jgi:hypothetical protein
MAMIKCPDCGKDISSRAKACPFCGCPSEYFNLDVQKEENKAAEVKESNNSTDIDDTIKFNLCGYSFGYKADAIEYASMLGSYANLAHQAFQALDNQYNKTYSLGEILSSFSEAGQKTIDTVLDMTIEIFYRYGINLSKEQFLAKYNTKYNMDYPSYYEDVVVKYSKILDAKEQLNAYREQQKAARGRWIGGGFGVSGAIKGAVTAGLMNFGSDMLHSFSDSEKARKDNAMIASQLSALKSDPKTRSSLVNSIINCIMNCFNATMEELYINGKIPANYTLSKEEANAIYENTVKYEEDEIVARKNYMKGASKYPHSFKFYEPIYDYLIKNELDEFKRYIQFWNIEFMFPHIDDDVKKGVVADRLLELSSNGSLSDFDFNNKELKNALDLIKIVEDFCKENEIDKLPDKNPKASLVKHYFYDVEKEGQWFKTNEVFSYIQDNNDLDDYFAKIKCIQKYLPHFLHYWLKGDYIDEDEISDGTISRIIDDPHDEMIFYADTSMSRNGKNGIAMTKLHIVDLKTSQKYPYEEIKQVYYDEIEGKPVLTIDGSNSMFSLTKSEYFGAAELSVLCFFINDFIRRFCNANGVNSLRESINKERADNTINVTEKSMLEISKAKETFSKKNPTFILGLNDNLRNTLGIANDSMVLFAYDSSGNGNGKEGFAITSDGVYTKSFDYNLTFTPIRDYINISSFKCDGYKLYGYLGEEEYRRLIRIGDIPLPLLTSKMDHAQDDMIEVLYVIRNELKISLNGEPETKEDYVPISEMKMDIGIDDIGADEISIKIAKWFLAVKTNFDKLPWEKVNDIGKVAEFKTDIQSVNILKWKDIIDQYPKARKLSQEQLFYIAPLGKSDKELIVEDYYGEPVFTRTILTDKGIREPYGKICPYSSIERIVIRNMGPKLEYRVFMKGESKFSFPSDFKSLDIMYLCLQVIIEYLNKGRVQILKQDGIEYCPKCFSTNLQSRILVKQCVNCGYKPEIGSDMPKVGYPKWYAQAESVLIEYLYEVFGLEKADANTNNVELDKIEVDRKPKESEKEIITANEDLGAINEKSIEDICYDFLNRVDKNAFIVTEKIQKGLSIPQGEKIILAHDDTLFKNGKNGFAITEKGIYCRGMMENQAAFTSFSEIQNNADKIEWGDKDHYIIKLNGKKLVYFYEQNPVREELMSLILTIANTRL